MAPVSAMSATLATVIAAEQAAQAPQVVFAFSGEGVHSQSSDLSVIRKSPTFEQCAAVLAELGTNIEDVLEKGLGTHVAPWSAIATTIINVCLCDLWRSWGYRPDIACGHSVGEIAAAYVSGLLSLDKALRTAFVLGGVAAKQGGAMLHTQATLAQLQPMLDHTGMAVAAVNNAVVASDGDQVHVTLCGSDEAVAAWLQEDAAAARMRPRHPWHHPSYGQMLNAADRIALEQFAGTLVDHHRCKFYSATAAAEMSAVDGSHWLAWLTRPVNFAGMVESMLFGSATLKESCVVVEIGAHPVLGAMLHGLRPNRHVSSMCRDQDSAQWIMTQRAALVEVLPQPFSAALSDIAVTVAGVRRVLLPDVPFGAQGLTSVQYGSVVQVLNAFFPGVKTFDLYRFSTIHALMRGFGVGHDAAKPAVASPALAQPRGALNAAVLGVGLMLPPEVTSCDALWDWLSGDECAVRKVPGRQYFGGYLSERAFDAKRDGPGLGVEPSEARVIDPQHVMALALAAQCFEDAGKEMTAETLATPDRCGVYLGAWQAPPLPEVRSPSAYRALGTSLSAIASRVANAYNIQGPAITVNTACSSGLVAVDNAMKDLRAGVIDYALVGGVNLFTDDAMFSDLARANFLSPTGCCHTFGAAADGYARAEGGAMLLLARDDGVRPCRALVCGSATNQNSQRRPMTAVDPLAQERVVRAACASAGIRPADLAAVECHGTGTKLGDPVEISALAATVGSGRRDGSSCQLTAAKMRFGHLESAAGALGLLKAVVMAQRRRVPGDSGGAGGHEGLATSAAIRRGVRAARGCLHRHQQLRLCWEQRSCHRSGSAAEARCWHSVGAHTGGGTGSSACPAQGREAVNVRCASCTRGRSGVDLRWRCSAQVGLAVLRGYQPWHFGSLGR